MNENWQFSITTMSETKPDESKVPAIQDVQEPNVEQNEPQAEDSSKMTFSEVVEQLDPEFLTPEMKHELDRIGGLKTDYERPGEEYPIESNEPAFDSSYQANELRELIFGDGNGKPGLKEVDAKLLKLSMPAKYNRLETKDHAAIKASLESKFKSLSDDINAIAQNYFKEDPTFKIHANIKVTISEILQRVGLPQDSEEPDEYMNPSRVPS